MFKKILIGLSFTTLSLFALTVGDSVPQNIQNRLHLKSDKIYIITFFASWCKSCKKELPLLSKVYRTQTKNIRGINVDKYKKEGKRFVQKLKLPFPVFYDTNKNLIETFNPIGFPSIYYVRNGKVLKVIFGAVNHIDKKIAKDLQNFNLRGSL